MARELRNRTRPVDRSLRDARRLPLRTRVQAKPERRRTSPKERSESARGAGIASETAMATTKEACNLVRGVR